MATWSNEIKDIDGLYSSFKEFDWEVVRDRKTC
jgi:hypothetical protein